MPPPIHSRGNLQPASAEPGHPEAGGEREFSPGQILIVEYNPRWPELYAREEERIRRALAEQALRIEHAGSTSVPGLAAKPVIDVLLEVADSANESAYVPALEAVSYVLRIREANWHQHRMFTRSGAMVNLHVFSSGCPETGRMLLFRDWLRKKQPDRELYAQTKLALARKKWKHVQDYADAKTAVVEEILSRARAG